MVLVVNNPAAAGVYGRGGFEYLKTIGGLYGWLLGTFFRG